MKTYGLVRRESGNGDWMTGSGKQSRKAARRQKKDKKMLHRRARRTAKIVTA